MEQSEEKNKTEKNKINNRIKEINIRIKINERKRRYKRQESMYKKEKGVKKSIWEKGKLSACYGGGSHVYQFFYKIWICG